MNPKPTRKIIIPYTNPDLDGVACALGLEELLRHMGQCATAAYLGRLDAQTLWALSSAKEVPPVHLEDCPPDSYFVLVDTHHLNQLPSSLPCERVLEVVDHHPSGDRTAFPNAAIQNELVGAAATLVVERFQLARITPGVARARLLGLGILANTLGFHAPSTDVRDRSAFDFLCGLCDLGMEDWYRLRSTSAAALAEMPITQLIGQDVKVFNSQVGPIAIAQLETEGVVRFGDEKEAVQLALESLRDSLGAAHALVNLVDLRAGRSVLYCGGDLVGRQLQSALNLVLDDGALVANRVLLRKTDLVPALARLK